MTDARARWIGAGPWLFASLTVASATWAADPQSIPADEDGTNPPSIRADEDETNPPSIPVDEYETDPTGPFIFAAEDTLAIPAFFQMSTVEITADRLSIEEIVDRCIAREEELRERIVSHEYQQFVKTVQHVGGFGDTAERRFVLEQVDLVRFRKEDGAKTIPLKTKRYKIEDGERREWDGDDDSVKLSYQDLNELPFYLADRGDYSFDILSREIVGDRVIYEVRLEPKSDFEIAPEGTIWVDTSNFQILREEFDFGDRVPMPLFIKSIGPFVRERERVGDLGVWKRFLARVDIRRGVLKWMDKNVPDTVEFVVVFREQVVNGRAVANEPRDP
jgi:hypothetical protein